MNPWKDIDPKLISPDQFISIIEIPKGSKNKYELDKQTGLLRLDRILYTATHYPANYGFIPLTLAEDHDPLDVLLLTSEPISSLTEVTSRPIGMVDMIDQGDRDVKIIAVCPNDPFYANYKDISELPKHIFDEITFFFETYKVLEGKETRVPGVAGSEAAKAVIKKNIQDFKDYFKIK